MSVWDKYLPETRVRWDPFRMGNAIWPSEPNLDTIKEILASELLFSDHHDLSELSVRFLADGASHKVYEATHPSLKSAYVMRVAIAVDPCLKTESEMATLEFLRQRTSVPVPKVISWSSTADNKLGYEWSIEEKIPGVELIKIWHTIPWDKKVNLTKKLATYMAQIWDKGNRFNQIGSLYLTDGASGITPRHVRMADIREPTFSIGPMIDYAFSSRRRLHIETNRGPYNNSQEWLIALVEAERDFIKTAKLLIDAREEAPEEYRKDDKSWSAAIDREVGVDSDDFLEEYDTMMSYCEEYIGFIPTLYPKSGTTSPAAASTRQDTDNGKYIIYNRDIRGANIMADPETFEINALIDWESVTTCPAWFCLNYSLLINLQDPFTEREARIPTAAEYDEDSEDHNPCVVDNRERWETRILRKDFDKQLESLGWGFDGKWKQGSSSPLDELKRDIVFSINELNDYPGKAKHDLIYVRQEWEKLERKRKDLEGLAWRELQAKVALRDKHCQELREMVAEQEEQYKQMIASLEEEKREIEEKYGKKNE